MAYRKRAEDLEYQDIEDLKAQKVSEGWFYEYKADFPKDGIGKSVAAFANTNGGLVLIGVRAATPDNTISEIAGISKEEGLKEKVRNQVVSTVHPIPIFYTRLIELPDQPDRCLAAVVVPESPSPPHILTTAGRVYVRNAEGSDPAPVTDRYTMDRLYRKAQQAQELLENTLAEREEAARVLPEGQWRVALMACPTIVNRDLIPDLLKRERFDQLINNAPIRTFIGLSPQEFMTQDTVGMADDTPPHIRMEQIEVGREGCVTCWSTSPPDKPKSIGRGALGDLVQEMVKCVCSVLQQIDYSGEICLVLGFYNITGLSLKRTHPYLGDVGEPTAPYAKSELRIRRTYLRDYVLEHQRNIIDDMGREWQRAFGLVVWD